MTNAELVEKVARTLSTWDFVWEDRPGEEPDYVNFRMRERARYRRLARGAIAIVLEEAAKMVETGGVVPINYRRKP